MQASGRPPTLLSTIADEDLAAHLISSPCVVDNQPLPSDPSITSLQGRKIRITGLIELYHGKQEILSRDQIREELMAKPLDLPSLIRGLSALLFQFFHFVLKLLKRFLCFVSELFEGIALLSALRHPPTCFSLDKVNKRISDRSGN